MSRSPEDLPPGPTGEYPTTFTKHGLDEGDLALIREMLKRTPTERLQYAEAFAQSVYKLKNARPVAQRQRKRKKR